MERTKKNIIIQESDVITDLLPGNLQLVEGLSGVYAAVVAFLFVCFCGNWRNDPLKHENFSIVQLVIDYLDGWKEGGSNNSNSKKMK